MNAEATPYESDEEGHFVYHNHMPTYWRVIIALSVLTIAEFGIAFLIEDIKAESPGMFVLGVLGLILLAVVKAVLVARVFMHLKYDPKILSWLCVIPVILGTPLVLFCIWDGLQGPAFV